MQGNFYLIHNINVNNSKNTQNNNEYSSIRIKKRVGTHDRMFLACVEFPTQNT